jgi:predicted PurR-regulated permease PerM
MAADPAPSQHRTLRPTFDGVLAAIVVGILLVATALTLRPFFPAILWSIVLAITAAPLHDRISRRLPERPRLAAFVTTTLLVIVLVLPALALTRAVIAYTPAIVGWVDQVAATENVSTAPDTVRNIPFVGDFFGRNWDLISSHLSAYVAHFKADIEEWLLWALQEVETVGVFVFEFGLAVILAGVFLANQERLAAFANVFFARIGGPWGVDLLHKSVQTTRSTVRGVVGTAVAEAAVATFAYYIAGVPAWMLLGAVTFFAALIQIGAPLVWIPVALWLLVQNELGWAIFMVAWGLVVINAVENLARPYLASRGTDLPGLLVFIGVLGGLFAWGLIGVFLGPVILAVAYELIRVWLATPEGAAPVSADPGGADAGAGVSAAPASAPAASARRPRKRKGTA